MPNPTVIQELLSAAKDIGYGKIPPYSHNELYTIGAFDLITLNIRNGDAFDLLTEICSKHNEIKNDAKYLSGYIYLLEILAQATTTTELPKGMNEILAETPTGKTEHLRRWYRIAG